jgi:hypothetical protein
MPRHAFDLAQRSAERAREQQPSKQNARAEAGDRDEDARILRKSIEVFYGSRFPAEFDAAVQGSTVTVTKKAGKSALKIEVLPMEKFKLSGGSGPGGFNADLAVNMNEVSEDEMMDTLEDWFNISHL